MTIKHYPVKRQTLEEFAAEYGLIMRVYERPPSLDLPRYYAMFLNVERKAGEILCSEFGEGNTEQEAIAAYVKKLSGQRLVIDAYRPTRVDLLTAPELTYGGAS